MNVHKEKGFHPVYPDGVVREENWPYPHHPSGPSDRVFSYKGPKFERHIYIRTDQVLFDIDSQLSMIATTRRKADGTEDDNFTNATTTHQGQFQRWIEKHIGVAKGVLSAFTLDKFHAQKMNTVSASDEVDIELQMPEYWDDTVFDQLVNAVHDYIVNSVLNEYLTLTLTAKDPVTADKREQSHRAFLDIKHYGNAAKPGFIHKRLHPF